MIKYNFNYGQDVNYKKPLSIIFTAFFTVVTVVGQPSNRERQEEWRKNEEKIWYQLGITNPLKQQESLLDRITVGFGSPEYWFGTVSAYNYLRDLRVNDPTTPPAPATSLDTIDTDWVNKVSREVRYKLEIARWQEQKQEDWRKEGITTSLQQQEYLLSYINYGLSKPEVFSTYATNAYNDLREILKGDPNTPKKPATSLDTIDKNWVNKLNYEVWKEQKQEKWRKEGITNPLEQQDDLLFKINYGLKNPKDTYYFTEAVYAYNYLRELHSNDATVPQAATSLSDINKTWLESIKSGLRVQPTVELKLPKAQISLRLYALALKNASPADIQKHDQLKALYNQLPTTTATQQKIKKMAREKFKEKFNVHPNHHN